jgi:hypothetical protein
MEIELKGKIEKQVINIVLKIKSANHFDTNFSQMDYSELFIYTRLKTQFNP